jgi:cytochrome c peroxidase
MAGGRVSILTPTVRWLWRIGMVPAVVMSSMTGVATIQAADSCRYPTGWNAECLRSHYAGKPNTWPAPRIDAGVAWREWASLPAPQEPAALSDVGRTLFFDPRLSRKGKIACASCHQPARAFTDGRPLAVGEDGLMGRRRSQPLLAAPFSPSLFWDGREVDLAVLALAPITDPREMNHPIALLTSTIDNLREYRPAFLTAFGSTNVTPQHLALALASYIRTLRPARTRFDDFLDGDRKALTDQALIGMHLFRTQARCMNCHHGPLLTDHRFHNIGLAFAGRRNQDLGRFEFTRDDADFGAFRTPSLRNVARGGPWMHNGIFPTLTAVIRMYNASGNAATSSSSDPKDIRSPHMKPLSLGATDIQAIQAFLEAL